MRWRRAATGNCGWSRGAWPADRTSPAALTAAGRRFTIALPPLSKRSHGTQRHGVRGRDRAVSAQAAATAYCQGTPLRGEIEARDGARMPQAIERATDAIARGARDAPVAEKIQAHLIAARR